MIENKDNSLSFIHQKFRFEDLQEYDLRITYSLGDLSVMVFKDNELYYFKNFNWHSLSSKPESDYIRPALVSLDFIGKGSFKTSMLFYSTPKSTIIPTELFTDEYAKKSLEFLIKEDCQRIISSQIVEMNAFFVFALNDAIFNVFKSRIPALQFESWSAQILKFNLIKCNLSQDIFHLHIHNKHIECTLVRDKNLVFHNFFSYQTAEELTFYVLSIAQQLGVARDKSILHLSGSLTKDSSIYQMLYKYFYSLQFVETVDNIGINTEQQIACFPFFQKNK